MAKVYCLILTLITCLLPGFGDKNEDFSNFIVRFSADSSFQVTRIIFPIKKVTLGDDLSDLQNETLEANEWQKISLFCNTQTFYTDIRFPNNKVESQANHRIFSLIGIENGIEINYHFEMISGLWYLAKIEDFST